MEPLKERKKNIYNGGCIIIIDDHKLNSKRKKKEERINEKLLQPPLFWAVRKRQEKRKTSRLRPKNKRNKEPSAAVHLYFNGSAVYLFWRLSFYFRPTFILFRPP